MQCLIHMLNCKRLVWYTVWGKFPKQLWLILFFYFFLLLQRFWRSCCSPFLHLLWKLPTFRVTLILSTSCWKLMITKTEFCVLKFDLSCWRAFTSVSHLENKGNRLLHVAHWKGSSVIFWSVATLCYYLRSMYWKRTRKLDCPHYRILGNINSNEEPLATSTDVCLLSLCQLTNLHHISLSSETRFSFLFSLYTL